MEWDDLRYFATLAKVGSVRGAAEQLGVNPSTVTRRLDQMEQDLGVRLFNRSSSGLRITLEGAGVVAQVEAVGLQIEDIQQTLKGLDQRLAGGIRVAVPDVLAVSFLLDELKPFTTLYPDIDLEIIPSYQDMDLKLADVDVAIRATDHPPQNMVGRPLSRVTLCAYAGPELIQAHPAVMTGAGVPGVPWVDWVGTGEVMALYRDLQETYFPAVRVHIRCGQIQMHQTAIRAGMGMGILPRFLADGDDSLVRLPHMPPQMGPMLWLLSHADLRKAQRVRVFLDHVRGVFERRQDVLIGEMI